MKFEIEACRYHQYGSATFMLVADLLNLADLNCGEAIKSVYLYPHFSDFAARLGGPFEEVNAYLDGLKLLPETTFSRRTGNLSLKYLSKVCLGSDLKWDTLSGRGQIDDDSLKLMHAFLQEVFSSISSALQAKLKPSDDFDLPLFTQKFSIFVRNLPDSPAGLSNLMQMPKTSLAAQLDDSVQAEYIAAMSTEEFWKIMELVDKQAMDSEDETTALAQVISYLSATSVAKVQSFQNHLTDALYELDTRAHFNATEMNQSDDSFLYVRCYVVARGRRFYESVLDVPTNIPNELSWCESLMYVASEAWSSLTQDRSEHFDDSWIQKSYETGSNIIAWSKNS